MHEKLKFTFPYKRLSSALFGSGIELQPVKIKLEHSIASAIAKIDFFTFFSLCEYFFYLPFSVANGEVNCKGKKCFGIGENFPGIIFGNMKSCVSTFCRNSVY